MSDQRNHHHGDAGDRIASLPRAPDPSHDTKLRPQDVTTGQSKQTDEPLMLESGVWDIASISANSALMMLVHVVQSLSVITGEVPPTPPITRPPTPKPPTSVPDGLEAGPVASSLSSPESPVSPSATPTHSFPSCLIGSPEAQRDEPMPTIEEVAAHAHADAMTIQYAAIARRFFLKSAPPFSLSDYLQRLHKYCPHSPGVYLTAAAWIHRVCVTETLVPATARTVHRLCLATIRVASKTLEDNKWPQERVAKVGGIALHELARIEISLCFLLDFNLFVRAEELQARMWQLQQTTRQGLSLRKGLNEGFKMRLPSHLQRMGEITAA
ncbi:hypothetical protein AAFC00_004422 [Neodothiora populina]|uniref:Cyclin n=1 Tax=Neodothiora populina TaxID=2781224 RepID=A0ABR3PPK2_9PEZI